jgi:hypothetical protein
MTTPEPLIDPDCRDGKHPSCVGGPCECMCHDPAPERPVTTEDLTSPAVVGPAYAAVYEVIRQWPGTAERNAVIWRAVEAHRAALAGDPGDLPARMAEALTHEHYRRARLRIEASPEEHSAAFAEVAVSVRWEHAAHLAARLAVAEHTAEREVAEHQVTRERLDQARRERNRVRHLLATLVYTADVLAALDNPSTPDAPDSPDGLQ